MMTLFRMSDLGAMSRAKSAIALFHFYFALPCLEKKQTNKQKLPLWIAISFIVGIPMSLIFLQTLQKFPRTITYASFGLLFLIYAAFLAIGLLADLIFFVILGIVGIVFWSLFVCVVGKRKIELVARLLEVATTGLNVRELI